MTASLKQQNGKLDNIGFNKTHHRSIVDLLRAVTKDQLFLFDGHLYEQTNGDAMGSPLDPLLANFFMCSTA